MKPVPQIAKVGIAATALALALAGAAFAQSADVDEHGRPSRWPPQADWWAGQAAVDPKPGGGKPEERQAAVSTPTAQKQSTGGRSKRRNGPSAVSGVEKASRAARAG